MRATAVFLLVLLSTLSTFSKQRPVGDALEKLADAPSRFVLYSLDPSSRGSDEPDEPRKGFHGYDILGRAEVTDTTEQRALLRALARGTRENDNRAAACFDPRHGLRVEQADRSVDLVICFECLQVRAYGFQPGKSFLTSASPQASFDDLLRRHHLRLAPK